ncbi:MAG TPA: oligopeptide transporter, OPT family [Planctomycetota bacterium]|nr:oligopeptide transporter, OPT family [Planctomycetota bacterium]
MSDPALEFKPAVAPEEIQPELTFRALFLGAVLGIVFGAASTYLALRVGLSTSASVPIAVIAIWALKARHGKRAILEHNIAQTTGSAGESVAAAVVFTVPALIFLGFPMQVGLTTLIALTGGLLGVLMMVPLRRYLIVKEHGVLRYPEGKACAEILRAGERGGTSAKKVFAGFGVGAAFKALQAVFGGAKGTVATAIPGFRGAQAGMDVAPELVGVGYIIGYRTSVMMMAGSALASFILVPLIMMFGEHLATPLAPGTVPVSAMGPDDIWATYVKQIGAGAVATGGFFALLRALPAIASSIRASLGALTGGGVSAAGTARTDRDTPIHVLVAGALALVAVVWAVPAFHMNLLGAVLILVLGFLFSVVSSRITGEVGSTSSPLSGMTIAVLMTTCGLFLLAGWEGQGYARLALVIGAVICIAISNAGTCSQDLKTGFLVGATPVRQQGALLIGVLTSVLVVGWTAYGLNAAQVREFPVAAPFSVPAAAIQRAESIEGPDFSGVAGRDAGAIDTKTLPRREYKFVRLPKEDLPAEAKPGNYLVDGATSLALVRREDGIGAGQLRAPQAKLMATVIDGLLTHQLPWNMILIGVAIALFVELIGINSLTFAVGVYLPLSGTMPVFLGGLVRKLADWRYGRKPDAEEESEGTLYGSGLIAGASMLGIAAAMLGFFKGYNPELLLHPKVAFLMNSPFGANSTTGFAHAFGLAVMLVVGWLLFRGARDPAK